MELLKIENLASYFSKQIKINKCQQTTQAYVVEIFSRECPIITESLTLAYSEARAECSFKNYQCLADSILYIKSLYPEYLCNASPEYYDALAQNSYYSCYKLINKQWKLFEELADLFPQIIKEIRNSL